ncbi:LacI family DNA-binding transcriptional regulator [Geminicoccus flavidas]|uniref:LacI family DNA-binding transcriptional regulator n=1 Tax=Geminicoccus flavidas TaxID=2506407 RepID=UPI00135BBB72|nr:LacI family DNA-binding transcriptional regulator [Geminicoccus flavidas]
MTVSTIRSVAKYAGVSIATVSRALARPNAVRPGTREKVLAAVAALDFVPNAQAVQFRRRATRTVILLVRDISNPFYLDIFKGVEEIAFAAGYRVLMGDARNEAARVGHYVEMVRRRQADGLILMTGWLPSPLPKPSALPPIVVALEFIPEADLPTVTIDNQAAAKQAVDHLVGLGHRRIAHLTGPTPEVMSLGRHEGYLSGLAAAGIEPDPDLIVRGDFHLASGRAGVVELLARGVDFTAIFASSDAMAVGAINELRARGQRVPEDVSVVGFDDSIFAEACDPPLTTVRQHRREIGGRAMELMIEILSGRKPQRSSICVDVELVRRGTTKPSLAHPSDAPLPTKEAP